ncbi:RNA polymerase sigma factor [Gilvimarinus polysaccharolyticus]|uniref:RNA polymerase sigma factor n=1 Tax=Gilvimarinus polysaccharolyticus TaxID=863921 RepID=UPI001E4FB8A8|nr:sigma-70 family RNA polymerase sigma factor [Gilvimarinus polysaccharolyticus]
MSVPITPSSSDELLVSAAQQGNEAALVELINRHQTLLLAVARAIVGATHAEDTVQEAWLSVYRCLATFEGRSSFKTWVVRIVSNEAKTRLRRDSRLVSVDESEFEQPDTDTQNFNARGHWSNPPTRWSNESPDALLEEQQLQRCINKTLNVLPERQKAAFLLRDLEHQPLEDIAELLGISNANVRVLLHRARLTLMQVVNHYQETGQC